MTLKLVVVELSSASWAAPNFHYWW